MDAAFWFNVVMRWLHVVSAVVGIGATILMRFGVLPALERLPNGAEVLASIRPVYKRLVHSAIGLLLLTGFYNYLAVSVPLVKAFRDSAPNPLAPYHAVIGVKIILSLTLFGIAIAVLAPVPSFHEKRKTWLSVNVVLGLLIMLLAAYLRRLWPIATP